MPPPPYPPPPPAIAGGAPPSFLPWWALLAAVPFAVVQAAIGFRLASGDGSTERAMGAGLGRAMWGITLAALIAWVAWVAAKRPRYLAPIVFLCVYAFMTLGALSGLLPSGARAAAIQNATAFVRDTQTRVKTASDEWLACGAFDLKTVKTPDDLRLRVERLDALVTALRNAREAPAAAGERLRRGLAGAEESEAQRDKRLTQWAAGLRLENDGQVIQAFEKLLLAARPQFVLLQQEWGRWRFDGSTGQVVFNDPKAAARYTRQAAEITEAESQFRQTVRRVKGGANQ
jgi:hypothetical protein